MMPMKNVLNIFTGQFWLNLFAKKEKKPVQQIPEKNPGITDKHGEVIFHVTMLYRGSSEAPLTVTENAVIAAGKVQLPSDIDTFSVRTAMHDHKWILAFRWWNSYVANVDRGIRMYGPNCKPCYYKVYSALNEAKKIYDKFYYNPNSK